MNACDEIVELARQSGFDVDESGCIVNAAKGSLMSFAQKLLARAMSAADQMPRATIEVPVAGAVDVETIMKRVPTVARLYVTGLGTRRYRRASTRNGPGDALVHRSHAEREIRQLAIDLHAAVRTIARANVQED